MGVTMKACRGHLLGTLLGLVAFSACLLVASSALAASTDIAFIRSGDVYRMTSGGHKLKRLTKTKTTESDVIWSPTHTSLAFVRQTDMFEDPPMIYAMPGSGGTAKRVRFTDDIGTPSYRSIDSLAYSPDGNSLAFTDEFSAGDNSVRARVCVVDLANNTRAVLYDATSVTDMGFSVSWSPDGATLAVAELGQSDENGPIRLIDVASRAVTVLPVTGASRVAWSPDDKHLLVTFTSMMKSRIAILTPAGALVKTLAKGGGDETSALALSSAAFSPGGGSVIYVKWGGSSKPALWTMKASGASKRLLLKNGDTPAWR